MIDNKDLIELSKMTGWNLLKPNNRYCPQIVYGNRDDCKNFCCLWWSDYNCSFFLCCKVNEKGVFRDKKLKFKKLETYVKWCKKAEKKMREWKNKEKLKSIEKDF